MREVGVDDRHFGPRIKEETGITVVNAAADLGLSDALSGRMILPVAPPFTRPQRQLTHGCHLRISTIGVRIQCASTTLFHRGTSWALAVSVNASENMNLGWLIAASRLTHGGKRAIGLQHRDNVGWK